MRKQTAVMRSAIKARPYCERCATGKDLCAHHIVPICEGGPDLDDNIAVLCGRCHAEWHRDFEGDIHFKTFLRSVPAWFEAAMQDIGIDDAKAVWTACLWFNLGWEPGSYV